MSNNIVIYTKPEVLLHKLGMFPNPNDDEDMAFGKNIRFYWMNITEKEIKKEIKKAVIELGKDLIKLDRKVER